MKRIAMAVMGVLLVPLIIGCGESEESSKIKQKRQPGDQSYEGRSIQESQVNPSQNETETNREKKTQDGESYREWQQQEQDDTPSLNTGE